MLSMFMISDKQQLLSFISDNQKAGGSVQWLVRGDRLYFVKEKKDKGPKYDFDFQRACAAPAH